MKNKNIPEYLPIDENHNLARHTSSMAVVNTDKNAKRKYQQQKAKILAEKEQSSQLSKDVESLRSDVKELKNMFEMYLRSLQSSSSSWDDNTTP